MENEDKKYLISGELGFSDEILEENIGVIKFDITDIHYWKNPKTDEWNSSIIVDGKKARLRAGIIIVKDKTHILLGEEEGEPGVFSLPGGGLDKGETPLEAAIREAKEEVHIIVTNAKETGLDYCVKHDDALPWVKENIPEEEWWYHYYTCLCIGDFADYYHGKIKSINNDPKLLTTSKFYEISAVIDKPSFKPEWKNALIKFGYLKEERIDEKITIHKTLNPKIWDENNNLLEDVEYIIYDIVDEFKTQLEEDNIDLDIVDIYILGSNANYNYTDESDLDVHIIADESFDCESEHLQIIYNAYKSLFNSKYDITIKGIDVELYVENEAKMTNVSTGIYSMNKGWIKEPSQYIIPDIDEAKFEKAVAEWEKRYLQVMKEPTVEKVDEYIDSIYDLRIASVKKDGEFGFGNLVFKEIRRLKYLENLKKIKLELKSEELSLK